MAWQNRIIGQGEEAPDQILANPSNWRRHPDQQQRALEGALNEIGWVQQVIVNKRTGQLIDGHLRVTLALRRGEPSIPVLYVDLSEQEEKLALATLDPIAALAQADKDSLARLLDDITIGDAALQEMIENLAAKAGVIPPTDIEQEWQGMPEVDWQQQAVKTLIVHFKTEADVADFCLLIGQDIGPSTKTIWHPKKENGGRSQAEFLGES